MTRFGVKISGFAACIAAAIRDDASLYFFIAVYTIVALALLDFMDAGGQAIYAIYLDRGLVTFCITMPIFALIVDGILTIHRFDGRRKLAFKRVFSAERMARLFAGLCLLLGISIFFGSFTSIKTVLPLLHGGFPFDRLQADIDAMLHFGIDPWRLLQPLWGTDVMRGIIEWNYNVLWFLICYGALFFVATSPRARHFRLRYMFGFVLVWVVVGNLLAGMFLSAGPAFYGLVTGDNFRFAEQLDFLARSGDVSFSAARYQNYLWSIQESGRVGVGSGISAFPSVHVALISFNAFFLYGYSRKLGVVAFAYAGFVAASSVYLAWHYAIDAYVGFAVSGIIVFALKRARHGLTPAANALSAANSGTGLSKTSPIAQSAR